MFTSGYGELGCVIAIGSRMDWIRGYRGGGGKVGYSVFRCYK